MPLAPYISAAELRDYLGETDPTDDPKRETAILAASAMIERFTGRDFGAGTRTEAMTGLGGSVHFLRATPIASVTAVTVDGVAVAASIVDGGKGIKRTDGGFWVGEVSVTYVTTATVPHDVKLATAMTAQAILESPALDKNLTGVQAAGVLSGGYDAQGPGAIPRGAQSILSPMVRPF